MDAITDQFGSPTYVKYVVYATSRLFAGNHKGIIHIASSGVCSRYEQMMFICELLGLEKGLVNPVKWGDFAESALRPRKIELSKDRLYAFTGYKIPDWKEQTEEYIKLKYRSNK